MVFVTGSNGLLGSFVCRELLKNGYKVAALRRKNASNILVRDFADKVTWIEGDINDAVLIDKAISEADYVIHCAALISFQEKKKDIMYKVNVEGTANVINACVKHKIKKLCHVSSIAALGRKKNDHIIDEDARWENSEYNSNYANTKYQAELEVWRGIEEGVNAVIVNPSVIIGPGEPGKGSSKLIEYVWKEHRYYTDGMVNIVDVRDVTKGILQLLFSDIHSERFILNQGNISYKDLLNKLATLLGKKNPNVKATKALSEIAWRVEKIKSILTGKEPAVTKEIVRKAMNNHFYPTEKIKRFTGLSFISLDETLQWTCNEIKPLLERKSNR